MSAVAVVLLLVLAAAFGARLSYRVRPVPRRKAGESEAEARTILLGTYRIYTWLVWVVAVTTLVGYATGQMAYLQPGWYQGLLAVTGVLLLWVSAALYWRLGYDWRRWLFVLGHLTGAFCIAEYLWALRRDVADLLPPDKEHAA